MSDVTTSLRAQEITERTQARVLQAHAGAAAKTPQAVFPGDNVVLSDAAQELMAGAALETGDSLSRFQQAVASSADDAISEVTTRLNRLMSVYGLNNTQTNISDHKVIEVLRNEVRRLAGTVEPPTINTQVRQELNFIVRQMEVKMAIKEDVESPDDVSVDFGSTSLEYGTDRVGGGAVMVVRGNPRQERQAETGIA